MQSLRNASILARLVLAWFALFLGMALASPVVKPQAMELVCSGAGVIKLLVKGDDTGRPATGHTLDCPLCVLLDAPATPSQGEQAVAPNHVLQSTPVVPIDVLAAAAPLPARGPPSPLSL